LEAIKDDILCSYVYKDDDDEYGFWDFEDNAFRVFNEYESKKFKKQFSLAEKYNLDAVVANDLLSPNTRSVVENYNDYIYLVLHFPVATDRDEYGKRAEIQEVDFIFGKDKLVMPLEMAVKNTQLKNAN
jgi:hypothetical protein